MVAIKWEKVNTWRLVAALSTHKHFLRESWLRYFGVTHGQMPRHL